MNDVTVTIVGNALTLPEIRRTKSTDTLVATFRVASTSRRFDKDSGRWVDGPSLRVRVTCWRRLAEGVKQSVHTGDPLIVHGRLYTRDWVGEDGQHRVAYELEASAVGHDLSRGSAEFTPHRAVRADQHGRGRGVEGAGTRRGQRARRRGGVHRTSRRRRAGRGRACCGRWASSAGTVAGNRYRPGPSRSARRLDRGGVRLGAGRRR